MPKLFVAMYRPQAGNYEHWALYLDTEHKIYEVIGQSPHFQRNVVSGKPTSSNRHTRSIFVYNINTTDLSVFKSTMAAVEIDNSTSHWNCQDYVIEALEKLEQECVIEDDDKAYIAAKKQVKKHYGPL